MRSQDISLGMHPFLGIDRDTNWGWKIGAEISVKQKIVKMSISESNPTTEVRGKLSTKVDKAKNRLKSFSGDIFALKRKYSDKKLII